jgi:CRP-like cAMP-binding protein
MAQPAPASPARNRLLAGLSSDTFVRLQPLLESVPLRHRQVLQEPDVAIEHVWFPESGLLSILARADSDHQVEVGLVGREGMCGIPVLLGVQTTPHRGIVQIAGSALRMRASDLKPALEQYADLRAALLRYVQAFGVLTAQNAACNARHHLNRRLARWLLMSHDCADDDTLPLTNEFLSLMLGMRRAGITVALQVLEGEGVIRADRGHITIRDRQRLQQRSCACYGMIRTEFDRLLA